MKAYKETVLYRLLSVNCSLAYLTSLCSRLACTDRNVNTMITGFSLLYSVLSSLLLDYLLLYKYAFKFNIKLENYYVN